MKNSWSTFLAPISVATVLAIGLVACDKKKEDIEAAAEGAGEETYSSEITTSMDTVSKNFVPASLKTESTTASASLALTTGDPCGTQNYFDCQPLLLKAYMKMAEDLVGTFNGFVPNIDQYVASKADDSTGGDDLPTELAEKTGVAKITYKRVTSTEYTVVMHNTADKPIVTLDVAKDGDVLKYGLDFFMENSLGYVAGVGMVKRLSGKVNYTDENTFDVNFQFGGNDCSPVDPGAADFVVLDISRDADNWVGKTMFRASRWNTAAPKTCSSTVTDATKLYSFTDFVASADKVTSSLYIAKGDSALTDMTTGLNAFASENFCTKIGGCSVDGKIGTKVVADDYVSPNCNNTTAETVEWGGACTDLPVADYSAASKWLTPAEVDTKATALEGLTAPTFLAD